MSIKCHDYKNIRGESLLKSSNQTNIRGEPTFCTEVTGKEENNSTQPARRGEAAMQPPPHSRGRTRAPHPQPRSLRAGQTLLVTAAGVRAARGREFGAH